MSMPLFLFLLDIVYHIQIFLSSSIVKKNLPWYDSCGIFDIKFVKETI